MRPLSDGVPWIERGLLLVRGGNQLWFVEPSGPALVLPSLTGSVVLAQPIVDTVLTGSSG